MKYTQTMIIVLVSAVTLICTGCKSNRIVVSNRGNEVIEITESNSDMTTKLGQNGTAYFKENSTIYIGEASIRIDKN